MQLAEAGAAAEAFVWVRRAAKGGNAGGMANLARMYELGFGCAPDAARAAKWAKRAAKAESESPGLDATASSRR